MWEALFQGYFRNLGLLCHPQWTYGRRSCSAHPLSLSLSGMVYHHWWTLVFHCLPAWFCWKCTCRMPWNWPWLLCFSKSFIACQHALWFRAL
jgi:hypothetical protein